MPFGLIISLLCHAALLLWAFWSMRAVEALPAPEVPVINAEIITPSEFLRLKQGSETAKKLETKPKEDDSKNDLKKPENAPPPPPPPEEVAKLEPEPPPPEPPKAAEPPPPELPKAETPPPPPEPAPGPTPEEQKALEQKIEQEKAAEEAKTKAEAEAKKKADEEAKKKAEEAKKRAEELKKKRLAEEAKRKKAEEAKKKFDPNAIANLLNKTPDEAERQKALLDKDPRKKGQQAAGTSVAATETGKEAGAAGGHDTVLSAREQDLLLSMIDQQLYRCAQMPGAGGANEIPVVKVTVKLNPDGSLNGEPVIISPQNTPFFEIAARASINAFKNCAPLHLPPDKYAAWKEFDWTFNWPKLLGLQ